MTTPDEKFANMCQSILTAILVYQGADGGRSPSQAEIAATIGLQGGAGSLNTTYLVHLRNKGYIAYEDGAVRGIRVIRPVYNPADNKPRKRQSRPCVWGGVHYESMAALARKLGISREGVRYRLAKEYKSDKDMEVKS